MFLFIDNATQNISVSMYNTICNIHLMIVIGQHTDPKDFKYDI